MTTAARKPIIHGRDHAPGGADPITPWPTGGEGGPKIGLAFFNGNSFPAEGSYSPEVRVPFDTDGSSMSFDLAELWARRGTTSSGGTTFRLLVYTGTGAFSGTTVADVTIAAGDNEATSTTFSVGTVSSGDKLRLYFLSLGSGGGDWQVQLRGTEA